MFGRQDRNKLLALLAPLALCPLAGEINKGDTN